ncbi:testis-expressed protein 47-like isoform X2 [Zootermopsis nevadensis]|uniref:BLUF domain-containing protein n=1 Tax=Zootermopsis nevadensis TaxID=136037 RepID=A0A067RS26_ZOONE|nr:testis-expressed protein 47-like isoform X2 [Zootermopsis nevadensis]KDR23565.1 hypothetical protein L798_12387 [Zootermopsis nevadensis]
MTEKRRSVYDLVKERFRIGERVTYLHRVIYVGEHSFSENPTMKQFFEGIIMEVNSQDPDEILTGFLLYYHKLFVHIVEGSEATILRHLRRVYALIDGGEARLGTMRVLIVCHNINERFFKQWTGCMARPPSLEGTDPTCDAQTWQNVRACVTKMYKLSAFLNQQSMVNVNTAIDHLSQTVPTYLPEIDLLTFLLGSKVLLDLRKYMNIYFIIVTRKSYQESIWPIQAELVPFQFLNPEEYTFLCDVEDVLARPTASIETEPQS